MNKKQFDLRIVTSHDYQFLYELLSDRKSYMNISHRKMPTYDQHISFIKSKPYTRWYIILLNKNKLGSIYLSKNNEIGIFLKKDQTNKGIGTLAIQELMKRVPRKKYLANINPKNKKSIEFFKKQGFNLIQFTFEYNNEKSN